MKNIFCIKIQVSFHDTKYPKSGKWKKGYEEVKSREREVKRGKWKVKSGKGELGSGS